MASANLELVRSIFAAWERGDFGSAEWAHPDIEYVQADGPTPGRSKGRAGLADRTESFLDAFEAFSVEAEEYRELDGERVLVLAHYIGRGRTSGVEVEQTGATAAHLFHVRGGKVTRLVRYFDRERALADLGLAPEARSPGSWGA